MIDMENNFQHFPLTEKLHTDVLEEKYGPVRAEVLRHDNEIREVHIVDESGVSRTYALTFLTFDKNNKEIAEIDQEIKNGGLIGKTFRDHGYEIRKNVIHVYTVELPDWLKSRFENESNEAKARLSEFYAKKKDESPLIYGIVTEIYSPDFREPEINNIDTKQDNPSTNAFELVGITKGEIWDRIGDGNLWSGLQEKLDRAKELAKTEENNLAERVARYLNKDN
ncbi:MAG: hypothetical protein A2571_03210 [Candidatus Vogelbacteria bacterium RIFOXYD1_FULL_44_32]|uniref:Uncharacterized protein n=1 Tax=Candidatus Vogelbacteria bacterium RIFOXYD1_FULL_44_32 TaxID=1802438 RepID=A0A1G2QCE7_9BACT|nr:MAG: hypothetical protein A2571_03210 [Candidatus Vogelbacteria bacterium RIFOXYD1_FULL_44_32]